MSKELTEQWRNGKLEYGYYYFKTNNGIKIGFLYKGFKYPYDGTYNTIDDVVGVLAEVPTYEEWKAAYECQLMESEEVLTLKQQLKEANRILNWYNVTYSWDGNQEELSPAGKYLEKYKIDKSII